MAHILRMTEADRPPAPSCWRDYDFACHCEWLVGHALSAMVPVCNLVMVAFIVQSACKQKAEAAAAESRGLHTMALYFNGLCQAQAMEAVATFMIAVGSTLLLVGLYYYIFSNFTALSNDLFITGGIVTGTALLLLRGADYWKRRTGHIHYSAAECNIFFGP